MTLSDWFKARYQLHVNTQCAWLVQYLANRYSQYGEDGLIAAILGRMGVVHKRFLDIGCADGRFMSNTRALAEDGWTGVMVDCDEAAVACAKRLALPGTIVEQVKVVQSGPDSPDAILARHGFPQDFDVLSLDVDGEEFLIWLNMIRFHPRLVVIEFNQAVLERYTLPVAGASEQIGPAEIRDLCCSKGYVPVAQTFCNVLAVRLDCYWEDTRATTQA